MPYLTECSLRPDLLSFPLGVGQGVLERGAILKIKLERGALKAKNRLERGAILELAGARSAEGKIGGRSLERQCQKGSERGAPFTPAPPSSALATFLSHEHL